MDEAAAVRRAARDAVGDVEPDRLREHIDDRLADASMVPGILTLYCVRAFDETRSLEGTVGSLADPVAKRAAGVQLIYDGLRLTRYLSRSEPWAETDRSRSRIGEANVAILAADVLVARGFHLLARTEAADDAVGVVRQFGRDQTRRRTEEADSFDRNLEADVLELAAVAGTTIAGRQPTPALCEYAAGLANGHPFENEATFFPEAVGERLGSYEPTAGSEGATAADH